MSDGEESLRWRRRLLVWHLLVVLGLTAAMAAVNLSVDPDAPWFLLFPVAWGAPLALHVAWAMGLFDPAPPD